MIGMLVLLIVYTIFTKRFNQTDKLVHKLLVWSMCTLSHYCGHNAISLTNYRANFHWTSD